MTPTPPDFDFTGRCHLHLVLACAECHEDCDGTRDAVTESEELWPDMRARPDHPTQPKRMTEKQWCDHCESLAVHSTETHAGWIHAAENVCTECGGFGMCLKGCFCLRCSPVL